MAQNTGDMTDEQLDSCSQIHIAFDVHAIGAADPAMALPHMQLQVVTTCW